MFEENDENEVINVEPFRNSLTVREGIGRTKVMSSEYTELEITLFALALILSFLLLLIGETREVAAVPPFLAWLMVNRRQ